MCMKKKGKREREREREKYFSYLSMVVVKYLTMYRRLSGVEKSLFKVHTLLYLARTTDGGKITGFCQQAGGWIGTNLPAPVSIDDYFIIIYIYIYIFSKSSS